MKHSSSSRCGCCCFCCCCCCLHFWLTMLLVASSVVHVSPEGSMSVIRMPNPREPSQYQIEQRQSKRIGTSALASPAIVSVRYDDDDEDDNEDRHIAATALAEQTSGIAAEMMTIMMELTTTPYADGAAETQPPQIGSAQMSNANTATTPKQQPDEEHEHEQQQMQIVSIAQTTTTTTTPHHSTSIQAQNIGNQTSEHLPTNKLPDALSATPFAWDMLQQSQSALLRLGRRLPRQTDDEQADKCRLFVEGEPGKNELYSPDYPNDYFRNINCTRVITAPKGQIIRLDFRNSFHIESKEECKFDFLEIRDGKYGFSNLIGKYCGTEFPPEITSKERYLWLHFHSDESIEYSGFTAVYEFIDRNREAPSTDLNCTIEKDGYEGFINSTDVPQDIRETVIRNKIPLDCMWRIQVLDKWKIQVKFIDFKLSKPNDCETNFLDIFPEQTVMPLRVKNFCGSAGEGITSDSNILHIRFYAEQIAINSTFAILYTAFRDRGSAPCTDDEYDCEDATCISNELECNGRDNCKFRWDEEGCATESTGQSEHVVIIIVVFGLILGGMVITFLVNCVRKIMRDHKIIREHIRQSKESKLDEMGRNSKARSRENISTELSARQKHSQTSLQILDDVSQRYYREALPIPLETGKINLKETEHHILRHHNDMIVQTSLCSGDDSSTTTSDTRAIGDRTAPTTAVKACDMGCQTRESLFGPNLMRQKSTSSTLRESEGISSSVPPPPRFSTFGYDMQRAPSPAPAATSLWRQSIRIPHSKSGKFEGITPVMTSQSHTMPTRNPQEICHHHHQHQQHLQQQQKLATLPHGQGQHVHHSATHLPQAVAPPSLSQSQLQSQPQSQTQAQQQHQQHPHPHQQHQQHQQHPHQHQHQSKTTKPAMTVLPIGFVDMSTKTAAASTTGSGNASTPVASSKGKQQKADESKVYIDIRNSAPDVIIMTSH